jgi:hypothetical protein
MAGDRPRDRLPGRTAAGAIRPRGVHAASQDRDIAYQNKAVVYDLLFRASSEAVTVAADPKHLGARIGITAVLHTCGSTMTQHDRAGQRHRLGWETIAVVPVKTRRTFTPHRTNVPH